MKRILTSILAIYSLSVGAGLPPSTISGERDSTNTVKFNLKAPNYQSTNLGGLDSRIETGNTNLLVNPSFEHSTVTTGWTITNATASADTANQVEGKKALSLALTGALSVVQDSTINAANLVGLQGVARIKVKTSDVDGLKVCARNAGVTSTSLCINIPKDGVWKEINIPYILTATSNGIAITSTGTTGTVKLDDAFVGTSAPFQGVNGAKLVGTVTITGCSASWSTTSTSFASFATQTGCTYTTTGSALSPSTNIPAIKFASLPAGDYRLEYEGQIAGTSGTSALYQFSDGTNVSREISDGYSSGTAWHIPGISQTISYSTSQTNMTFEIKAKVSSGTGYITGTTTNPGVIKVWYFPPESKIYSQASQDTDWQPCTFSTLAWQGLGTVTNNLICKRSMGDLLIKGSFTTGTTSASIAQIPLPTNFGTITTSSLLLSNSLVGFTARGYASAPTVSLIFGLIAQPSQTYLNVSNNGNNQYDVPVNGSTVFNSTEKEYISELRVPINEWKNYGVIVGSFAGIEKCANDYECTDTFSAQISITGVVSNENLDWINGNCTNPSTGNYTCTYNTILKDGTIALSSPMSCNVTPTAASSRTPFGYVNINSTTSVSPQIVDDNGNNTNSGFFISCQKGTNDYKPKTAKVATSIGVPTVPGISTSGTGNSIDTFSFTYAANSSLNTVCTVGSCYVDQIGNIVTGVAYSGTAVYTASFSKTYAKLKCAFSGYNAASNVTGTSSALQCQSCSSLAFTSIRSDTGAANNSYGTLYCQGSY